LSFEVGTVSNRQERVREYRATARELEGYAQTAHLPYLRSEFLQLAEMYGRLADTLANRPPLVLSGPGDGIPGTTQSLLAPSDPALRESARDPRRETHR
jgi:hypothetical protein